MWVHKQRRPARRTKLVHALLLPKQVPLHLVLALLKDDVLALGIDVQITVLAADGAVAAADFLGLERLGADFVLDGAAVAVGFVPDFGGGGVGHGVCVPWVLID